MNEAIKNFIEKHSDLIDKEDFTSLYSESSAELGESTSELTRALLDADINPLNYLKAVPNYFLKGDASVVYFDIPNKIKSIGYGAFDYCTNLVDITIPNSVTLIDEEAFRHCEKLTSITIPNKVRTLGDCVFQDCTKITNLTIPSKVDTIPLWTVYGCTNLESVVISDGVERIAKYAFEGCPNLTTVVIGKGIHFIGNYAFLSCDNLTDITYRGTKAEWEKIMLGPGWSGANVKVVHCVDGDIEVTQ